MTTTESNKLIAEFMGVKPIMVSPDTYSLSDTPYFSCTFHFPEDCLNAYAKYAKYDTSWDWLMPVVEKIESKGYDFSIDNCYVRIWDGGQTGFELEFSRETKIKTVYSAVVGFIQWYNKKKDV